MRLTLDYSGPVGSSSSTSFNGKLILFPPYRLRIVLGLVLIFKGFDSFVPKFNPKTFTTNYLGAFEGFLLDKTATFRLTLTRNQQLLGRATCRVSDIRRFVFRLEVVAQDASLVT